ncbi:hypothetical protein AUR64_01565 [Haloprofundus marisrubri]|uniref:Uncharacterized protein n=1 Tax=Haloprofundus marisrubri TaxID=1514971 RepID=A0A0W1R3M0_9EURY|nr:hypothetical protein [Haloprofundus marisrubri]KTG07950.1 hypothetical protein AUR64_01565 [Haloprofundus marisrubri]
MRDSPSSRRTVLRRLGAVGAFGALGGAATGCLGRAPPVFVANASESTSLSADTKRLDETTFDGYVSRMGRRYGESGVWGTGAAPAPTEADFERATRLSLRATSDGEEYAVADAAVARYGLRRFDTEGRRHVAYWLWCAAKPLADSVWVDTLDRSLAVTLSSFEVGLDFDSSADLFDSAPSTRVSGPQAVSVATPGETGGGDVFDVDFPLHEGRVRPRVSGGDDAVSSGDDGSNADGEDDHDSYRLGWRGRFDGIQSVNGLCVAGESVSDSDATADWHVSLSASGWA